jgi:hypothetical protein
MNVLAANIFPNPAKDVIHIQIAEMDGPITLTLHSMSGQLLRSEVFSEPRHSLPIAGLPGGVYLIGLQDNHRLQTYSVAVFGN